MSQCLRFSLFHKHCDIVMANVTQLYVTQVLPDAELAPCMLCCLVHVSKRKPHVQELNWWKRKKFIFIFTPVLSLPSSDFSHTHQNSLQPFSFPLKPSSPSPLQNNHHRRRSTVGFWRTKRSLVKVILTSISPSPPVRFHHFFAFFFVFSFNDFVFKFWVFFGCLD